MFDRLHQLYQQTILEHSKAPRNFRLLPAASCSGESRNPLCGDRFTIFLKMEGSLIQDIAFQGSGCAIAKAAASMMTEALQGKTAKEAQTTWAKYKAVLQTGPAAESDLGDLRVFGQLHQFPARVKCARLPWEALAEALAKIPTTG